ncbi:type II toxin-antitoxin system Phd/YefM family antitoxin [Rhodopila sp.]|uniref:type II toxin-antitoxin system Phd/YefM family antitoxin n=1 Tax=Rhodopila sp. TaxID=2480087 RepID=UPI003D0C5CF7
MDSIGAFETKTQLSALLERVAKGESFTITRRGTLVAQLVSVVRRNMALIKATLKRMEELAAGQTLHGDWRMFRDADGKC